jgi:hypothetical protein
VQFEQLRLPINHNLGITQNFLAMCVAPMQHQATIHNPTRVAPPTDPAADRRAQNPPKQADSPLGRRKIKVQLLGQGELL